MDKFSDSIFLLESKGVIFDKGLSEHEIAAIESYYKIKFPLELKQFYALCLPISKGFYNWRDTGKRNTEFIQAVLNNPIVEMRNDLHDGYFWCDEWGEKPIDPEASESIMNKHYSLAPKLIPIYSHRYIPAIEDCEKIPIFSVMGTDIICYGEDLISYFDIEFGSKQQNEINVNECLNVPFWSELI
jgi:hypothetical protein